MIETEKNEGKNESGPLRPTKTRAALGAVEPSADINI